MSWLILAVYVAIAVAAVVPLSRGVVRYICDGTGEPDPTDWYFGAFVGLFMAAFWPFFLVVAFVTSVVE